MMTLKFMLTMIHRSTLPRHQGLRRSHHRYDHHHHQNDQNDPNNDDVDDDDDDSNNDNANIHLASTSRAEAKSSLRKIGASMFFAALPGHHHHYNHDNGD